MNDSDIDRIAAWVVGRGLGGASESELLHGFCDQCRRAGLELSRGMALVDTLHPIYEGRAFRWRNDGVAERVMIEYGRTNEGGAAADNWQRSVFHHLLTTGGDEVRRRIGHGDPTDFLHLEGLKSEGETDYVAFVHRFGSDGVIGEMDCIYSHWTTRRPEGFGETDLEVLRRLGPPLALAIKCASLARVAGTLVEVYLGRDAGQRVLSGRIARGVADRINAVLWFSDLRGYTTITDTAPPDEIIPLLNDYADAVIVNEVSRIASMCRSVDPSVVLSSDFVAATPERERAALVSVGRYALRGVGRAQELFTLDPGLQSARSDERDRPR